jgi:hypothetical protein
MNQPTRSRSRRPGMALPGEWEGMEGSPCTPPAALAILAPDVSWFPWKASGSLGGPALGGVWVRWLPQATLNHLKSSEIFFSALVHIGPYKTELFQTVAKTLILPVYLAWGLEDAELTTTHCHLDADRCLQEIANLCWAMAQLDLRLSLVGGLDFGSGAGLARWGILTCRHAQCISVSAMNMDMDEWALLGWMSCVYPIVSGPDCCESFC